MDIYYSTGRYAREHGEVELLLSSHLENVACRNAIEKSCAAHFDGMYLNQLAVIEVLEQFDPERVALVLAATVQDKLYDGRFSRSNKEWSRSVRLLDIDPDATFGDVRNTMITVSTHPAILDGFIGLFRKAIA